MGTAGGLGLRSGARPRARSERRVEAERRAQAAIGPLAPRAVAATMYTVGMVMWTLGPVAILWATPRVAGQPSWLIVLELALVVGELVALGWVLSRLDWLHCRLTSVDPTACRPQAWARPFTNPAEGMRDPRLLDRVVAVSATSAFLALVLWWLADSLS